MNTPSVTPCPRCGAPVPLEAPHGLCPRCVLADAATPDPATRTASARGPLPSLERVRAAFPQLEVVEPIGAGGMGVVFKARQPHLDRFVALKLLPETLARDPRFAERFNREARVLARLNHPNIVTVHDFGQAAGFFYLLMEFVDGVNLREAMRAGRFSPTEALTLVPKICEALQFAHDEGILHRDIKPENILLDTRGRVKIADFGIAKLVGADAPDITLTASGAAIGTPQYMAPEQIEHPGDIDHRADIYSLGVVFYELLTGELPIGRFAAPSHKVDLDARIDEIVLRALAKEREHRQQSATEVQTQVEEVRKAPPTEAPSTPAPQGAVPPGHPPPAATPTFGSRPGPDYLLGHPSLPRMAQAITVYALLSPLLWILGMLALPPETPHGPYAQFASFLTNSMSTLGGLAVTAVLFAGGWKLRGLQPSGPRWLRTAFWLNLGLGALVIAGTLWTERLESHWPGKPRKGVEESLPSFSGGDALVGVLMLAALGFEIAALVWLTRHRHALAALIAQLRPESPEAAEEAALTAPASGLIRGATWSATLTAFSLTLGLVGLGGASLYAVSLVQSAPLGLSPAVFGFILLGLALTVIPGLVGAALGFRGLHEARRAQAKTGGVRRVVFGALGWPLVILQTAAAVGMGFVLFRLDPPGWMALFLTCIFALGCGEVVLRGVWRWLRAVPRGERAGRAPGWTHALATGALIAGLAATLPALTIGLANYRRANLPPMEAVVRPDASMPADPQSARTLMELPLTCPGRSLVWLRTALLRNGQLEASPLSTVHILNSAFETADGSLLVRADDPPAANGIQWEFSATVAGESWIFIFRDARTEGTRWRPIGQSGSVILRPGDPPAPIELLSGQNQHGDEFRLVLTLQIEPLTPSILFDGVALAEGNDWSATAQRREQQENPEATRPSR